MREASIVIGLVLMGCSGSDKNIGVTNNPPKASITSHANGDQILEGISTLFVGAVSDDNDSTEDLLVTWYADLEVICPEAPPEADATTRCEASIGANTEKITLTVRDPFDSRADASITIEVVETEAPEAQITSPVADTRYYAGRLITFEGLLSDAEDDGDELTAYWTSSIDGELSSVDATPNSNGEITGYGNLSEGQHIIELHVEDSSGKTNKDSLIIDVAPPNTAPTCGITEPTSNSAGPEGQMVTFRGQVDDLDMPNNDLTVVWTSDKDGEIGRSTPNATGLVNFPYDGLSLNTHVISMTVTDDLGEECVSDIIYTVGSPPTIALTSPTNNATYNENATVSFVATVSDSEDAPADLTLVWTSSIDGVFSNQQAASNGTAQFNVNSLSYGNHDITATVTDTTGLYAEAIVQITINGRPTQPTVTITPNPAYSSNNLTANATGSIDPEGSAVTYTYDWLLNGASSGHTGSTLPSSVTTKGDNWTVRATPSDGTTTGPYGEAVITITNAIPVVNTVSISPNNPSPSDDLTCSYGATDADGDTVSVSYQWTMGANILSSTSNILQGPFQQGDALTCSVTPYDGTDYGMAMDATVTVNNTPPTITTLNLSPNTVYTNDVIQASANGTDADGDPITYAWDWYVDTGTGFVLVQSNAGSNSDTLDGVYHFDKGDQVYVILTISDGSSVVSQTSSTVSIQNTLPSAYNVLITPTDPVAGIDDLECIAQGSDADGDTVTFAYAWEVNGSSTNYSSTTIPATDIADADVWECIVTPNDGTINGATNSATVTIGADTPGATGGGMCSAAGLTTDAVGNQSVFCFSEVGVAGEQTTDTTYTWQPGSMYVFSPE